MNISGCGIRDQVFDVLDYTEIQELYANKEKLDWIDFLYSLAMATKRARNKNKELKK